MDAFRQAGTAVIKFLMEHGIIVFSTTVAGGILLGPEGAALAGVGGAAVSSAAALSRTARWASLIRRLTVAISTIMPVINSQWFSQLTRKIADLVMRLLHRALPSSTVYQSLMPAPGYYRDRDGAPPAC